MTFKSPMLAKDYDENKLVFPKLASVKLDGWRSVIHGGVVTTRSGKAVRNEFTQKMFGRVGLEGLDGEIIVGPWNQRETFNRTDSGLKKQAGEPDLSFYVFDNHHESMGEMNYVDRRRAAAQQILSFKANCDDEDLAGRIHLLSHAVITNLNELELFEEQALDQGFEGVMLRDPNSPYKFGRSTVNEGYLLKVKRFTHDEATIIGYDELMHNGNEAFKDELGRTKRTSHAENRIPSGMIGSYIVSNNDLWPGMKFNISCGSMTHAEKKERFRMFNFDLGKTIRFKHLAHGAKDVPRHGVFDGFRAEEDAATVA